MNANDVLKFDYDYGDYYLHNAEVKEANIAFDEKYLEKLFNQIGFKVEQKYFGYWSGREKDNVIDYQDVVILKKL